MCECLSYYKNFSQSNLFYSDKPKTKLIDINDEKSLKENNISYEETISEFDKTFEHIGKLNEKIKEEIFDLNKSRRIILSKISRFFRKKHHLLSVKHKSLKLSLNPKVDEVEKELNNFLIESERIKLSCKRISEAIKNFGEKNENKIKELCYISEINKNNQKAKVFFNEPKRTLDFTLNLSDDDFESSNYESSSYYFSGLPVPEDINVEENGDKKIVLSWKINKYKITNYYDRYKIKYSIELKNENNVSKFETSEKKVIIQKLLKDTNYKVRIKTMINVSSINWSKIKEFKIDDSSEKSGLFGNICLF